MFYMNEKSLIEEICVKYCPYYKPSKDEALGCRGLIVVRQLIQKGRIVPIEQSGLPIQDGHSGGDSAALNLIRNMCPRCEFHEKDCAFAAKEAGSSPCGGFIVLRHLLEADIIDIDDIENIK
jgi:hypothetical protein